MFSSLHQGSTVYVLDKTDKLKLKCCEVVGVSAPKFYNMISVVSLKLNLDGTILEFDNIPSNNIITSYNNGKLIISETKQGLLEEVESIVLNSKQILNNLEVYRQNIIDGEEVLKELNPQFAKDKERDDRLNNLERKFSGVEDKIDKILTLVTNK